MTSFENATPANTTNSEGLTWEEWAFAAGYSPEDSLPDDEWNMAVADWQAGIDPSDVRAERSAK